MKNGRKPIRVMLVDDHKILREALRAILGREPDIVVAGEAESGSDALVQARELQPDVVVMDIGMDCMSGIEATRRLLRESPAVKVLALSTYTDRRIVLQMLEAGANGYVVKASGQTDLLRAIRAVVQGRSYISSEISGHLIENMRGRRSGKTQSGSPLGNREREVLQLLTEGLTSPAIASRLHIATSTVEVHRRNIMRKLDLHNIVELTKYAIRHGLTSA